MSAKVLEVIHLQRKPIRGFHSVERLFEDVREQLQGSDVEIRVRINHFPSAGVLPRLRDAFAARRAQAEVNHVTGDVHYLSWMLDPSRTILTVLDCVGLSRLSGWRRAIFKQLWYTIPVRRSRWITVISEFTRDELIHETGCDPRKIVVIYPHLSEEFQRVDRPFRTERARILQVGTAYNKNIERLACALRGMDVELVVIGQLSDSQREAIVAAGISYQERIGLTRSEILSAYVDADVVALASTYEGFGLPIIEAQAIGRPVITGNSCSMPEVAGNTACIVDSLDPASIRQGVEKILADEDYRKSLVAAGFKNVQRFRLQRIAEQYADLYRQAARDISHAHAGLVS